MTTLLTHDEREHIQSRASTVLRDYADYEDTFELLRDIARDQGVRVYEADLFDISGALKHDDSGWAIYINRQDSKTRQLFTLAHELGHYFLHRNDRPEFIDGEFVMNRDESTKYQKEELEANEFAAGLIMPVARIQSKIDEHTLTPDKVLALADKFQVSPLAMAIRLKHLGYAVPAAT